MIIEDYFIIKKINSNELELKSKEDMYKIVEDSLDKLDISEKGINPIYTNIWYKKLLEIILVDYFNKNFEFEQELLIRIDNSLVLNICKFPDNAGIVANLINN